MSHSYPAKHGGTCIKSRSCAILTWCSRFQFSLTQDTVFEDVLQAWYILAICRDCLWRIGNSSPKKDRSKNPTEAFHASPFWRWCGSAGEHPVSWSAAPAVGRRSAGLGETGGRGGGSLRWGGGRLGTSQVRPQRNRGSSEVTWFFTLFFEMQQKLGWKDGNGGWSLEYMYIYIYIYIYMRYRYIDIDLFFWFFLFGR